MLEESNGLNPVKIGIFAAVLVAFAAVGYIASSSSGTTRQIPATAAKAPDAMPPIAASGAGATSATPAAAQDADPAKPQAAVAGNTNTAAPVAAPPPTDGIGNAATPSQAKVATDQPTVVTHATSGAAPKPQPEPAQQMAATQSSGSGADAGAPVDKPQHRSASTKKATAHRAASALPPALAALTPWWKTPSTSPFKVAAVGELGGGGGIVVVFSDAVRDVAAAGQKLQLVDARGTPVSGAWQAGENARVLVHKDLPAGRYNLSIDPQIASAEGATLGQPVEGPVFVVE